MTKVEMETPDEQRKLCILCSELKVTVRKERSVVGFAKKEVLSGSQRSVVGFARILNSG